MEFWLKAGAALLLGLTLVLLLPRAKLIMQNTPTPRVGDWRSAILPLLAVAGLVALLMMWR